MVEEEKAKPMSFQKFSLAFTIKAYFALLEIERQLKEEDDQDRSLMHWFVPHTSAVASTEAGRSQELDAQCGSPTQVAGSQVIEPARVAR